MSRVDLAQVVVEPDFGAWPETGHGDHLNERAAQPAMRRAARHVDEVADSQGVCLEELGRPLGRERGPRLDPVDVLTCQ